ncbi:MAG: family 16 glycosylhydrolase [Saprospiraceae bacterium]
MNRILQQRLGLNAFVLFSLSFSFLFNSCDAPANTQVLKSSLATQPIWVDEFDYEGLPDSTKWSYDVGDGCPHICGWGNNELEFYTENEMRNARVEKGNLIIEAHQEVLGGRQYTSARLVSRQKGDWKYGRIEVRAKLPTGLGTWPAIWMLPTDRKYGGWPASGEIDIMEHVGYNPDSIFGTIHTQAYNHMLGTQNGGSVFQPKVEQAFHTYSINWTADKIDWYLDDMLYHTFKNENNSFAEWPFDQPFHLILNVAVGGNWGGQQGVAEDIWPQRMEIDYVRVWEYE